MKKKTALVTGANRGIGFEVCRQLGKQGYRVLLAARDVKKGSEASAKLKAESLDVSFIEIDVTNTISSALMKCLTQAPIKYTALAKFVESKVKNFDGSVGWYVMSCLRELEVQGKVIKTPKGYSRK